MSRRPIAEFDPHAAEYASDPWTVNRRLREESGCPVVWSTQHGGFWVALGYDEVKYAANNETTFSSRHDVPNGISPFGGIQHPPSPAVAGLIEADNRDAVKLRHLLNPWFSPTAVENWRPKMAEYSTWCLDQVIETGEIDFVEDLGTPVPAILTLDMMGMPLDQWKKFGHAAHDHVSWPEGTAERAKARQDYYEILWEIVELARRRRTEPVEGDFLSFLTQLEMDGRRLTDEELRSILITIVGGGMDTTTALVANAAVHLGYHPEQRQRLIEEPKLMPRAADEFLRYFTPVQMLARTCTRPSELGGQRLMEGDRVMLSWAAANFDETVFERPDEFIVDRFPNRHASFGFGIHRCMGLHFARHDFAVILGEVLRRIPDYEIFDSEKYESCCVNHGWKRVRARFTPGPRSGQRSALDALILPAQPQTTSPSSARRAWMDG